MSKHVPSNVRKYSKKVMLNAETCYIVNMIKNHVFVFLCFYTHGTDVIKNVKTCHIKCLGNTVSCTECGNMFHIVIIQCALIHTASVTQ